MKNFSRIELRDVVESDLSIFFEQQLDSEANRMAAFTSKNPADKAAFLAHWARILSDDTKVVRTILLDDRIVGHISSYTDQEFGKPEVTYWIGKEYWGKGIATAALEKFLGITRNRPIYARVSKDNIASRRVLHKCGFKVVGEGRGFANVRGKEIEELILKLE
jgi:RimJ/RimL family protein N-acetyltransferase